MDTTRQRLAHGRADAKEIARSTDRLDISTVDTGRSIVVTTTHRGKVAGFLRAERSTVLVPGRGEWRFAAIRDGHVGNQWRENDRYDLLGELIGELECLLIAEGARLLFGWFDELDFWHLRRCHDFEAISTSIEFYYPPEPPRRFASELEAKRLVEIPANWPARESIRLADADQAEQYRRALRRGDKIFGVQRNGRVEGLAVVRDRECDRVLLDWKIAQWDCAVIEALGAAVIGDGTREVRGRFWNADETLTASLGNLGFRLEPGDEPILAARRLAAGPSRRRLASSWIVTGLDVGLDALPFMSMGGSLIYVPFRSTEG